MHGACYPACIECTHHGAAIAVCTACAHAFAAHTSCRVHALPGTVRTTGPPSQFALHACTPSQHPSAARARAATHLRVQCVPRGRHHCFCCMPSQRTPRAAPTLAAMHPRGPAQDCHHSLRCVRACTRSTRVMPRAHPPGAVHTMRPPSQFALHACMPAAHTPCCSNAPRARARRTQCATRHSQPVHRAALQPLRRAACRVAALAQGRVHRGLRPPRPAP